MRAARGHAHRRGCARPSSDVLSGAQLRRSSVGAAGLPAVGLPRHQPAPIMSASFARTIASRCWTNNCTYDRCPGGAQLVRLTVLWAFVCAVNGAGTLLLLLLHSSIGSFLALRPVLSYGLVATGIAV